MNRLIVLCGIISLFSHLAFADESVKAKLDSCIVYYQDGEYQKAVDSIKAIIPLISNERDEAEAYKYIGFSYVMLDMINKAKEFFRVAIEKFPQLMVDTLDVPPNITIVFKQTQLETQMEKGELVEKDDAQDKRIVAATLLGTTSVISGIVGGVYLYRGYKSRRTYHNLQNSNEFDLYWNKQQKETVIGGTATGLACISAATAVYLMTRKPSQKKKRTSLELQGDRVLFTLHF